MACRNVLRSTRPTPPSLCASGGTTPTSSTPTHSSKTSSPRRATTSERCDTMPTQASQFKQDIVAEWRDDANTWSAWPMGGRGARARVCALCGVCVCACVCGVPFMCACVQRVGWCGQWARAGGQVLAAVSDTNGARAMDGTRSESDAAPSASPGDRIASALHAICDLCVQTDGRTGRM